MPRNGSGTYSLPQAPFVAGTVISSAAVNSDFSDIAAALTASLPRDGQAGMSGQLKLPDGSSTVPGLAFTNETNTGFNRAGAGIIGIDILGTQVATINSTGVLGTIPIGMILDFAGNNIPALWYACGGQAISRTTYALLFAEIGTIYGAGDGSTTFNIPDLRGITAAGINNIGTGDSGRLTSTYFGNNPDVLGAIGGLQSQTLTVAQIPTGITSSGGGVAVSVSSGSGTATINVEGINVTGGPVNVYAPGGSPSTVPVSITSGAGVTAGLNVVSNNTSGAAHTIIQPTMVLNKIIYAGA
jgi:microcystin-dependent protein